MHENASFHEKMAIHDDSPFKNRRHILRQNYLHQPRREAKRLVQNFVMSSPQENTNWINKDQRWFQPGRVYYPKVCHVFSQHMIA